ncbi:hypothetical protein HY227_02280 [Candidatus Wolfebacteria bacterium]|nr:hypothetical protein [Candidatus Wolfebacteria bacterium]
MSNTTEQKEGWRTVVYLRKKCGDNGFCKEKCACPNPCTDNNGEVICFTFPGLVSKEIEEVGACCVVLVGTARGLMLLPFQKFIDKNQLAKSTIQVEIKILNGKRRLKQIEIPKPFYLSLIPKGEKGGVIFKREAFCYKIERVD